jgi:ribosomal protein S27E
MKIKCPGCGKVLSIPETAAGKLVKCPCGKQLRAPAGSKTAATQKPATKKPAAKPATPRPAAAKPAPQPAAAAPQLDDDLFGELTDQDLAPVKSVYSPGKKVAVAKGGPVGDEETTGGSSGGGGISPLKLGFGVLLIIGGGVMIGAYFMGFSFNDDDGDTIRIRRRSPIGIGVGLIITGFGWAAAGLKGGKGE